MKKIAILAASITLAMGLFVMPACNGGGLPGEVPGNYTEVTSTAQLRQLKEQLSALDSSTLFGRDAESFGFEFKLSEDAECDLAFIFGENPQTLKADELVTADYKLILGKSDKDIKGEGNAHIKADMLEVPEQFNDFITFDNFDYSAKVYNDGRNIYLDLPEDMTAAGLPENFGGKIKLPLDTILSPVMGIYSGLADELEFEPEDLVDLVRDYGAKIFVDNEDGLKIKATADESVLRKVLKDGYGVELPEEGLKFNECSLEIYFAIDKDKVFSQFGAILKLDADCDLGANTLIDGLPAIKGNAKAELGVSLKKYDGKVELPTADKLNEFEEFNFNRG